MSSVESAAHICMYDETMSMSDTLYLKIWIYSQKFSKHFRKTSGVVTQIVIV